MPNQRRPGQTFIGAQLDAELLAELDAARGHKERSLFLREAIAEKLRAMKIVVPDRLIHAPPRARMRQQLGNMVQDTEDLRAAEDIPAKTKPLPRSAPVKYEPKRKKKGTP